jgi:hypothetical protein
MTRKTCLVVGTILLVAAILGFAQPDLLGMHLTPVHNVIHLVTGGAALYLAQNGSRGAVRQFCLVFGGMYLSLAVLGVVAPGVVAAMLGHDAHLSARALGPDNVVHVVLGGALLAAGLKMAARRRAAYR